MAKEKSAISGEYVVNVSPTGSIEVYRIFDNVKGALRETAEIKEFEVDPKWNTRQLGKKLIDAYGEGESAHIGNYYINRLPSGSIETYRTYENVKGALREIAEKIGFEYDTAWTTRQFGSKLVDYLNSKE